MVIISVLGKYVKKIYVALIFVLILFLLLWRAKYGFIWSDEPYYFETAYRFYQGDIPIVDDWYTAQLYSILLVPYIRIAKILLGEGFTGLFLYSRYLYVAIQFIGGLICYRVFRQKSRIASLLAAAVFMLYCRGNIATISYYSICAASLLLVLLMTYYVFRDNNTILYLNNHFVLKNTYWVLAGFLWGIVIICNPYLIALYFAYLICIFAFQFQKKVKYCSLVTLIASTIIVGSIFLFYIISNTNLSDIVSGISYVMTDKAYYGSHSMFYKTFAGILYVGYRFRYTAAFSFFSFCGLIYLNYKRYKNGIDNFQDEKVSRFLLIINFLILIVDVIYPEHSSYTAGTCMAALAVFGIQVFLISRQKDCKLFACVFIPGWFASLLMSASSDTHFSATTQGLMIAAVATIIMTYGVVKELEFDNISFYSMKYAGKVCLTMVCVLVSFVCIYDRTILVYRDKPIDHLRVEIKEGPAKGIITTEECNRRYETVLYTVEKISDVEGNIYIMNFCPWAYLVTNMRCSSYTAWRVMPDEDNTIGQEYYLTHNDKFPDIVLRLSYDNIEYDENSEYDNGIIGDMSDENSSLDYLWNHSELVDELVNKKYRIISVPCGIMYINSSSEYDWITEELFS